MCTPAHKDSHTDKRGLREEEGHGANGRVSSFKKRKQFTLSNQQQLAQETPPSISLTHQG